MWDWRAKSKISKSNQKLEQRETETNRPTYSYKFPSKYRAKLFKKYGVNWTRLETLDWTIALRSKWECKDLNLLPPDLLPARGPRGIVESDENMCFFFFFPAKRGLFLYLPYAWPPSLESRRFCFIKRLSRDANNQNKID